MNFRSPKTSPRHVLCQTRLLFFLLFPTALPIPPPSSMGFFCGRRFGAIALSLPCVFPVLFRSSGQFGPPFIVRPPLFPPSPDFPPISLPGIRFFPRRPPLSSSFGPTPPSGCSFPRPCSVVLASALPPWPLTPLGDGPVRSASSCYLVFFVTADTFFFRHNLAKVSLSLAFPTAPSPVAVPWIVSPSLYFYTTFFSFLIRDCPFLYYPHLVMDYEAVCTDFLGLPLLLFSSRVFSLLFYFASPSFLSTLPTPFSRNDASFLSPQFTEGLFSPFFVRYHPVLYLAFPPGIPPFFVCQFLRPFPVEICSGGSLTFSVFPRFSRHIQNTPCLYSLWDFSLAFSWG